MTKGFEQQDQMVSLPMLKSAPVPQHGQKPDKATGKVKEQRTFHPRPGH
jgi:hypothetical protein